MSQNYYKSPDESLGDPSIPKKKGFGKKTIFSLAGIIFAVVAVAGVALNVTLNPPTSTQAKAGSAQAQGVLTLPRVTISTSSNTPPKVGVNLNGPDHYMFADAIKTGRSNWDSAENPGDGKGHVDATGWPDQDFSYMAWEGVGGNDGTYQLSFKGQADFSTSFGYGTFSKKQYDPATNTTTATMVITDKSRENFSLIFKNTKRTPSSPVNSGVTQLKLMRPTSEGATTSYAPTVTFADSFKKALAPYNHMRFMFGTNWNTSVNWSDRTKATDPLQKKVLPNESGFEGNQMAFEYMVQLANETNKDLYINIPAKANDGYIMKLAQLVKYGSDGANPYTTVQNHPAYAPLNSSLHLYIEYSNEVWNWSFQQTHDVFDAANGEVKAGNSNLNYDGETNQGVIAWRYYARRVLQISNTFRTVFGDGQMITRIRPILEFQYANYQDTADSELTFLSNYYNNADGKQHVPNPHPASYYLWGAGGAVYYSSNNDKAATVDAIYASGIPGTGYQQVLNVEGEWAHAFGLHYIAYEGGFAVGGDGAGGAADASRWDPRAKQTMIDSFNDFTAAGGDLYTAGTYAQWQDPAQASTSPLVQAAALVNTPGFSAKPTALGTALAATGTTTIPSANYAIIQQWETAAPDSSIGNGAAYLVRTSTDGSYTLTVNLANNVVGGKFAVLVDGATLTTIAAPTATTNVVAGTFSLNKGLHSIMIRAIAAPANSKAGTINNLQITKK